MLITRYFKTGKTDAVDMKFHLKIKPMNKKNYMIS